ncbi:MAG: NAD(+) synthase, partial [Bacteroidetes bacterium]|nr:NAD(+) synthase [Bacteroidota bacterium]
EIPRPVIDKAPSADLWEGQTDEGEIGITYAELDSLLFKMIDEGRTEEELVRIGYAESLIQKVCGMMRRNEFKRRMPAIAKASYNRLGK